MASTAWIDLIGTPFSQRYYEAGGIRTRVIEAGSGEPLIFLHGTGGHAEAYTRNIAEHAKHFHVYALDMLGHGFTDKPDKPYVIQEYVDHLISFLDAIGARRAHFSGESLGGWVAAWLASQHPDRVGRLLLNTPGGTTANAEVLTKLRALTLNAVLNATRQSVRERLEWLMFDKATVTDELVEARYHVYTQPEFRANIHNVVVLLEMETRLKNLLTDEMLGRIQAPTLVLWTTHDPMAKVEAGEKMQQAIPGSQLVIMTECGHWPQYEKPEEFNRISLDFLLAR